MPTATPSRAGASRGSRTRRHGDTATRRHESIVMISAAVLTISDSAHRGSRADLSGPAVRERLEQLGWRVSVFEVLPDEAAAIGSRLAALADRGAVSAIF